MEVWEVLRFMAMLTLLHVLGAWFKVRHNIPFDARCDVSGRLGRPRLVSESHSAPQSQAVLRFLEIK